MKLYTSEILSKVAAADTETKRINILRENYSPALEDILLWAYDKERVQFFTNTVPPYTPDQSPEGLSFTNMYSEHKRFYIFLKETRVDVARKNIILTQMLEALGESESKVLEGIILRKIPEVSKELAEKAYPGLFQRPIRIPAEA